jgi:PEP-CTERM motif
MISFFQTIRRSVVVAGLALLAPFAATSVQAVPIVGGVTQVKLIPAIATAIIGAGVTPSATGTGSLDLSTLTFSFPITGGDLSAGVIPGSTIQHNGSGIKFTAGTISIDIGNFLIDTTSLSISGSVDSVNPVQGSALSLLGVPLFALAIGTDPAFPFSVSLTGAAAGALNATFGVTLFTSGLQIGNALTSPQVAPVPEPTAFMLLGLGVGGVAIARRRRRELMAA